MSPEAEILLSMYNRLMGIRKRGALSNAFHDFIGKPSHQEHYDMSLEIQSYALRNQKAVIELITTKEVCLSAMIGFLMPSGSVSKEHNPHLGNFFKMLDANVDKLTQGDQYQLSWFHRVHGY